MTKRFFNKIQSIFKSSKKEKDLAKKVREFDAGPCCRGCGYPLSQCSGYYPEGQGYREGGYCYECGDS